MAKLKVHFSFALQQQGRVMTSEFSSSPSLKKKNADFFLFAMFFFLCEVTLSKVFQH